MKTIHSLRVFVIAPRSSVLLNCTRLLDILRHWKEKYGTELKVEVLEQVDDTGYSFYQEENEVSLFVWPGDTPPSARDRSRLRLIGVHQDLLVILKPPHQVLFRNTLREFTDRMLDFDAFNVDTLAVALDSLRKVAKDSKNESSSRNQFTLNEFEGMLGNRFGFDLRAPLKLIADSVDVLKDLKHEPRYERSLGIVRDATGMILFRIMELLDQIQTEKKGLELQRRPFALSSLLQSIEMVLSLKARITETEFIVVTEDDVPGRVIGDPERVGQVLLGLMEKFLLFTPRSGIALFVEVDTTESDDYLLRFSASDSGANVGGAVEHQFSTANEISTFVSGRTGKADEDLVFNFELLSQMGGTVAVKSSPGRGTVLQINLPMGKFDSIESQPLPSEVSAVFVAGLTILVVDDNDVNRRVLEIALTKKGHQTLSARNGAEAVVLFEKHAIDVILMDIEMPVLDGIAATEKIRQIEIGTARHIPILAVTTRRVEDIWSRCEKAGIDGFVAKPIDFKQLWSSIKNVIDNNVEHIEARLH